MPRLPTSGSNFYYHAFGVNRFGIVPFTATVHKNQKRSLKNTFDKMPGHTPGSAVLMLQLERAGTVLLTGDLITHTAGRETKAIPTFNTDAAQTRASIDKFEALAAATNARVIIQHEPNDYEALPRFPQGLD